MLTQQDYFKRPEENEALYNQRIASLRSADLAQGGTRDLTLSSGDPAAILRAGATASQSVGQAIPEQQFGLAIMNLLKQYQTIGTRPFQEQQFNAQEEQAKRLGQQTPAELIGASPSVQSGVRNEASSALNPTIEASKQGTQTYGEQIKGVGDILKNTQSLLQQHLASQEKLRDDMRLNVNEAIAAGSEALESLIKTQPDVVKIAGYDIKTLEGFLPALKRKESLQSTNISAIANPLTGEVLFYNKEGNIVNRTGGGIETNLSGVGSPDINTDPIPPQIKAAISKVAGIQYIDTTKLTEKQKPFAQAISVEQGLPLVDESSSKELKRADQAYQSASGLLNTIEKTAFKVIKAKNPGDIPGQLITITTGRLTRNPDVTAYVNSIDAFISLLTRAAGEKGTLTNIDVGRIKNALPKQYDTIASAQSTLKTLRSVFDQEFAGAVSSYLGQPYSKFSDNVVQGASSEIRVRRKSDGITGRIPLNEFNEKIYEKL